MNRSTHLKKFDNRWREWARALSNHSVTRRRRPVAFAWLRLMRRIAPENGRTAITNKQFLAINNISIAPRIQLLINPQAHFSRAHSQTFVQTAVPVLSPSRELRFNTLSSEPREASAPAIVHSSRTLLRDLTERTKRIEERSAIQTRYTVRAAEQGPADPSRAEAGKRGSEEWWKAETTPRTRPHAASIAPINVEQITNNVLNQLDQRIGAWRERMGRR